MLTAVLTLPRDVFESTVKLFDVGGSTLGSKLTFSTNYRGEGEYTVAIFNPLLEQQSFVITSLIGTIASVCLLCLMLMCMFIVMCIMFIVYVYC
jgi:hypothetical protein